MLLTDYFLLSLVLAPSLASAALFPKNSQVKFIDQKGFKKIMKQNVRVLLLCISAVSSNLVVPPAR